MRKFSKERNFLGFGFLIFVVSFFGMRPVNVCVHPCLWRDCYCEKVLLLNVSESNYSESALELESWRLFQHES
jgi:hypothetical protein|uniref:Uncharacterized protein n=1 Tax=Populus trichocarpa TaxID=3694 RepID=A0A2K1R9V3_POPTR